MTLQSLLTDPSAVGAWTLDPTRSQIRFSNKTLWGLVPVNGRFTDVSGSGSVTADGAITGRVDIKAASLRTGIGMRDKHLRSPDFFDTDTYPDIAVHVAGADRVTLTIRGTTLPLPSHTTAVRVDANTVRITVRAEIDRTQWGVSGNTIGMVPASATLAADAVFTKSPADPV